jgi:UDP-N-acetylmuramate--alanine ligase
MNRIHFIGIGGVGMNGLAQLAALSGYSVSGSDRGYDPGSTLFQTLEELGVRMHPQDGSGIDHKTVKVVFSTAIEAGNPDLEKANALQLPLLHRAEFLKELIGDGRLIAVSGTAGKTTTTGLLGWIFEYLGEDPSVYNGAAVLNWKNYGSPGNVRKGKSGLWIIEADESDRSLLNFHPDHSIITNMSRDHFEVDELRDLFSRFETQTNGITVRGQSLDVEVAADGRTRPFTVPMPGKHNRENAACAVELCRRLGMDMERVFEAITRFKGIERRLEIAGEISGVTVIDDYAHNPAKIAAALTASTEAYETVHAYWRPHGFTPLYQCREDLIRVFKEVRVRSLFILPVFYAGGTAERKITSAEFAGQLKSAGIPAEYVQDYASLKQQLERCAKPGHAILGMGARDPELPLFAAKLVTEWKTH